MTFLLDRGYVHFAADGGGTFKIENGGSLGGGAQSLGHCRGSLPNRTIGALKHW